MYANGSAVRFLPSFPYVIFVSGDGGDGAVGGVVVSFKENAKLMAFS